MAVISRCTAIRYEVASEFSTTRSQAKPAQDHRLSPCTRERSRPSPCVALADTRMIGRSPEMPKRHNKRRSHTAAVKFWVGAGCSCARVRFITSAVASVCSAAKFSAPKPSVRSRMPVSVADIRELRRTLAGWRYLSITARSVAPFSPAAVAKVRLARECGSMRSRTLKHATGSSPVVRVFSPLPFSARSGVAVPAGRSGSGSNDASGWLALRLRPSQRWRSVCTLTWVTCATMSVKKCAACIPASVASLGLRSNTSAWCSASHCARTNRLENAGCASSARGSASVTSKLDTSSISSGWSVRLRSSILRNSMSSSGLTHTVVYACTSAHTASKHTRSAW